MAAAPGQPACKNLVMLLNNHLNLRIPSSNYRKVSQSTPAKIFRHSFKKNTWQPEFTLEELRELKTSFTRNQRRDTSLLMTRCLKGTDWIQKECRKMASGCLDACDQVGDWSCIGMVPRDVFMLDCLFVVCIGLGVCHAHGVASCQNEMHAF